MPTVAHSEYLDADSRSFGEAVTACVAELAGSKAIVLHHGFSHSANEREDKEGGEKEHHGPGGGSEEDCSNLVVEEASVYRKGLANYLCELPLQPPGVLNQTRAFGWRPVSDFMQRQSRSGRGRNASASSVAAIDAGGGSGAGFQVYCRTEASSGQVATETMLATAGGVGAAVFG